MSFPTRLRQAAEWLGFALDLKTAGGLALSVLTAAYALAKGLLDDWPPVPRFLALFSLAALVLVATLAAYRLISSLVWDKPFPSPTGSGDRVESLPPPPPEMRMGAEVEAPAPQAIPETIGVYTEYVLTGRVPSEPPPGQAGVYVVHLTHEDDRGGLRIDEENPNNPTSPMVYRCKVENTGDVALHEVRLVFRAAFYRGDKPEGSSRDVQHYPVSTPRLGPGEAFSLYLCNDSPRGADITTPDDADIRTTAGADSVGIQITKNGRNIPGPFGVAVLPFDGAKLR